MFTFQAIHNNDGKNTDLYKDVKELISMFTFQAIHNLGAFFEAGQFDVKELISMFTFQAAKIRNYFESTK